MAMATTFRKIVNKLYWKTYPICSVVINSAAKFNVPLSINNYKIAKLKNAYEGKRCFIVGNGPSLQADDLDKLTEEITFASNKIYKIFDKTSWRPTFYMAVDDVVVRQNYVDINAMKGPVKFTANYFRGLLDANIFFNINHNNIKGIFSKNTMETLCSSGSVSFHMLQIAFHMGFTEVFLIGHDHNYKDAISKADDVSTIRDNRNTKMYFCNDYVKTGEAPAAQAPDEIYLGMEKANLVYENAGRKIYNATRITHLDVFELVDFDQLMSASER